MFSSAEARGSRASRLVGTFVEGWCRLRPWERNGVIYERLGLRGVFAFMLALFGEALPSLDAVEVARADGSKVEAWQRAFLRTRYHELLNLIAILIYTPFFAWLLVQDRWVLAVYCGMLMTTHLMALLLERYKRARYEELLTWIGGEVFRRAVPFAWKPPEASLPPVLNTSLARWYFRLKFFDREWLFRCLGIGGFRRFVLRIFHVAGGAALNDAMEDRFVGGRADLLALDRQTRIAEATHAVGMLLHVPFAVVLWQARDVPGILYVAMMLWINFACVLLQRYHRLRIGPIVERFQQKEQDASRPERRVSVPVATRIVILSASAGQGHLQAAYALQKAFEREGVPAVTVDVLDLAPRLYRLWFQGGYETLVRYSRALWGTLYWAADRPGLAYRFQTCLDTVALKELDGLLSEIQPEWVLCTHSVVQPRLNHVISSGLLRGTRWAVVLTDLHPHLMWLRGEPDRVFVPHDWSLERLKERAPNLASRAMVTGIPVDPWFAEQRTAGVLSVKATTQDVLSVLVLAGGIGAGPLEDIVRVLHAVSEQGGHRCVEAIVVCGHNERNRERCLRLAEKLRVDPGAIRIEGFVPHDQLRCLMVHSDLLIGKAGGLTFSEALACGVPLIIYRPVAIPGQEDLNAEMLLEHGAALEAVNRGELLGLLRGLVEDPGRLVSLQRAACSIARPLAATEIARSVLGHFQVVRGTKSAQS